jgi:hypothetical protein
LRHYISKLRQALERRRRYYVPPAFGYRWEYSSLGRYGDLFWRYAIDPLLRRFAGDETVFLRRARGVIQIVLLLAILLIPASFFYRPSQLLTISGLLFDIAGALRLFLFEEIQDALAGFAGREHLPSIAMRELIMPEANAVFDDVSQHSVSFFYYRKRGVLFLFLGFLLQLIANLIA